MATSTRHTILAKSCSAEDGFTLIELLLTSVFMIFVIALVYQMVSFAQIGAQISARNNVMSGDVGTILDIEDRFLSQNTAIDQVTDYSYRMSIPMTVGQNYLLTITANTDGTLKAARFKNSYDILTLSKKNANVASGTPLLVLFDSDGNITTNTTHATSAKITIVAKDSSGALVSSSRTVLFRNR